MDEPRRITSLGHTRWSDAPAATLDARLGAVLLDHITARLAVIDREHRYLYANREMLEFLGWSAERGGRPARVARCSARRPTPATGRSSSGSSRGETVRLEGWVDVSAAAAGAT